MKAFKACIKHSEALQRSMKVKIQVNISSSSGIGTGRVETIYSIYSCYVKYWADTRSLNGSNEKYFIAGCKNNDGAVRGWLYERNWFTFRPYQKLDCSFIWLGKIAHSSINKNLTYEPRLAHLSELVPFTRLHQLTYVSHQIQILLHQSLKSRYITLVVRSSEIIWIR